jgi:crotonobetainyl-CoA:carnitine CoA-transferase CaiB-like acyl-CoA transferase
MADIRRSTSSAEAGAALGIGPLAGWRVLERCRTLAGTYCGKLLSDLGATVLKVERSTDDTLNDEAPDNERRMAAGRRAYLDTGKESVLLPTGPDGEDLFHQLVTETDILITDDGYSGLAVPDGLIWCSITPFGSTGPYAGYRTCHLVTFHAGGEGHLLPSGASYLAYPDRAPIQIGGDMGDYDTGANAAVSVLAACFGRLRLGIGQVIDVSAQESQLTLNRTRLSRLQNDGVVLRREGNRYGISGMLRCRDGYVQIGTFREQHWAAMCRAPASPIYGDDRFATAALRASHNDELKVALDSWCAERSRAEVASTMAGIGVPAGVYATAEDLFDSPQLQHRGFFRQVDDPDLGTVTLPGVPYLFSKTPVSVRPAPKRGSVTGFPRSERIVAGPIQSPSALAPRLLHGIRIVDFTWAAAGPYATLLLALLGAEVIKVESADHPDAARRGFLKDYGGIDLSPNFNELNLNKRSVEADLKSADGLAFIRQLIAQADVVVDNFRPGVMSRLGLGAETLLSSRPDLVVASSSANGGSGPEANYAGLASIFGAAGGLGEQTGYADGPPCEVGESTDYRSGNALAIAILAALLHRARTGEGQHIDISSREVVVSICPDAVLACVLNIDRQPRVGNQHRTMAPYDVYRSLGEDEWIAIAIGTRDQWASLCRTLGRPEWVDAFPTAASRRAAQQPIDEAIEAWTCSLTAYEAFTVLQRSGVPAAPSFTCDQLAADPHLAARDVFTKVAHPKIGELTVMRAPWLFSNADTTIRRHGPLFGQDTASVRRELANMPHLSTHAREEVAR